MASLQLSERDLGQAFHNFGNRAPLTELMTTWLEHVKKPCRGEALSRTHCPLPQALLLLCFRPDRWFAFFLFFPPFGLAMPLQAGYFVHP